MRSLYLECARVKFVFLAESTAHLAELRRFHHRYSEHCPSDARAKAKPSAEMICGLALLSRSCEVAIDIGHH